MPLTKKDITDLLDSKKIEYEIVEHQPVYTIDEMSMRSLSISLYTR